MLGTATVIRGNALHLPLPDASVDACITSPPYFGLRSYQDAGAHYQGQLGSEATPAEFLDALIAATAEMVRVLKPTGSIFINLGDKYAGSRMDGSSGWETATLDHDPKKQQLGRLAASQGALRTRTTIPTKSLMGLPWRYAIRCIDDLGLILRAEMIWSKPNGLPESVTDRVRRSHETWFHFTKQPRYFAAVDEIREPQKNAADPRHGGKDNGTVKRGDAKGFNYKVHEWDPRGKLPGSVWSVPTQPLEVPSELGVDHFAAYPMEWPRRIIQGWTPTGICSVCGEGRRPIIDKQYEKRQNRFGNRRTDGLNALGDTDQGRRVGGTQTPDMKLTATITGYACGCDFPCCSPTRPAVVLDPFGGTGTTALVAKALGRTGITVDLSADYCRLAEWRVNDHQQLAVARGEKKPPPIIPAEETLFAGWGEA